MTKDLAVQIVSKLIEPTDEQKQKIENYNKALEELPTLEVAVSLDGGKTFGGDTLKLDLKKLFTSDFDEDNEEEIVIDDNELIEFIYNKTVEYSNLSKEVIQKVLDLEFDFLKLKGVV